MIPHMTEKSLYLDAMSGKETPRPPVWMMRQAGRFLPEYRKIRNQHSFLEMMRNAELATTVSLQPIHRFGMDAIIMFCDILVTAEALGGQLDYFEGKGPIFENPIQNESDLKAYTIPDAEDALGYVSEVIKSIILEKDDHTPLIGFAGAPFTVGCYLIEGQMSKNLIKVKSMMGQNPELFKQVMTMLRTITIDYLNLQIKSGVDALQIFDSWSGALSYDDFIEHSIGEIKQIIAQLDNPNNIPVTVFCKGSSHYWKEIYTTGCDAISFDWQVDLKHVKDFRHPSMTMQGNLDPLMLFASDDILKAKVEKICQDMSPFQGFVFNLGHGIIPQTNPEKVALVVDTIKSFSK